MPRVYAEGQVEVRSDLGAFKFHTRRASDDLYCCSPSREKDVEKTICRLLQEGDTFIDIGANIGYYSVLGGHQVGPGGKVVAVEPVPETAAVLRRNLQANGRSDDRVVASACWSHSARLVLSIPRGIFGFASPVRRFAGDSFPVDAVPLDELCRELTSIRLIKIDVEGAEREVLAGAKETLLKTDYLVVEVSEHAHEVRDILEGAAFRITNLKFKPYILATNAGLESTG